MLLWPWVSAQDGLPNYIHEFHVPTPNSAPLAITVDGNGDVWFTESNASKLARFDPANQTFKEFRVPWVGDMWGVIADPRGYIWFTQYSGKGNVNPGGAIIGGGNGRIVRFDVGTKNFTSIPIPTNGSFPMRLALDKHGRIWFTEFLGNKIGVYDPSSSELHEYPIPTNSSGATDLTFDSQGNLWFSESYDRQLGKFSPQDQSFKEYSLGAETASQIVFSPVGIALDREGNVWVADHGGNWIVEFDPKTQTTVKYPTHFSPEDVYPISLVHDLLIDSKRRVWFAEHAGNTIGYYNPETRSMVEFPIPTGPISTTLWMALAPSGDVWFAEWGADNIGVVRSNSNVPLSVVTPVNSLIVKNGQQVAVPVQIKILRNLPGNGTLRYVWGSYNPKDLSGIFSIQYPSLANRTDISAQAQLSVSAEPGNYTLGLGIETQSVTVWTMASVEVLGSTASNVIPFAELAALGGAVVLAISIIVVLRHRSSHRVS
jgi:sugar lactone lactonase YvrE